MSLTAGTHLGPYEITGALGAGGMGEVYRATDSHLKRAVAIKVLPADVAGDADRLARFQREAEVLAALNHPNIAGVYGLEKTPELTALVMELVEGEDLSVPIARGPIALADALPIAKQIADALEAAHDQGIVHRDLKPANIKLRADGTVKVLDFGLAKVLDPAGASSTDAMNSPTLTARATQLGMILGTAAYMAPEQARGKTVDKRADIWAFGVVLYEMLTARRAFEGEDVSHTLANVIKDDADWQALPAEVPAVIRHLLRRCLEKDPRRRLRDIGEARVTLDDPASAVPATSERVTAGESSARPSLWRRALPIAATALIVGTIAGVLSWRLQPAPPPAPTVTRFPIVLPADQTMTRPNERAIAVSPDGTRIVYVANRQLYLREMGDAEARPIPGTSVDPTVPFFSPDGQSVGFASARDRQLEKVPITGGSPVALCRIQDLPFGASWAGDTILFGAPGAGLVRVPANGGDPEVVVKTEVADRADSPQMLDQDRLMFSLARGFDPDRWDQGEIVVQSLATGERRVVLRGGGAARFIPTGLSSQSLAGRSRGHLVYAVGNTLRAVPFDLEGLEVLGPAVPVVERVARAGSPGVQSGVAQYDVSATGTLAFVPGVSSDAGELRSLALVGLDGSVQHIPVPPQPYIHPRLSPDGRQMAVAIDDGRNANVWVYDLATGGALRRLTFGGRNLFPIWTRDGRFIAYQSDRNGDAAVFRQLADGSGPAERLTKPEEGVRHEPESWSADDRSLTINVLKGGTQGVWLVSVDPLAAPQALLTAERIQKHSTFSPDGRWIAYMTVGPASGPSRGLVAGGSTDVFIQPFPPTGAKYQVSTDGGGRTPAWSPDGKRLFFHDTRSNGLFVVDVHAEQQGLTFGTPVRLPIEATIHPIQQRNYDVTPDGKRLLVVLPAADAKADAARNAPAPPAQINVVLNWFEELRARAPAK
jgi:Tol biopolymer transport system component